MLIKFLYCQWPGSVAGQINSTPICLLVTGFCCQVTAYSPAAAKESASNWQVVTLQVQTLRARLKTLHHGTTLYLGRFSATNLQGRHYVPDLDIAGC